MPGTYDEWKSTEPDLDERALGDEIEETERAIDMEMEDSRRGAAVLANTLRRLDSLFPSAAPAQWDAGDGRKERATHMDAKSVSDQLERDEHDAKRWP